MNKFEHFTDEELGQLWRMTKFSLGFDEYDPKHPISHLTLIGGGSRFTTNSLLLEIEVERQNRRESKVSY